MNITLLKGDGIGPEVVNEGVKVLEAVAKKSGLKLELNEGLIGGAAIDQYGVPLPQETINLCLKSNAVLLGAVGGEKWDDLPSHLRPEKGLLMLRKSLNVYSNLRPIVMFDALKSSSPLKNEILGDSLDILIVRELTGGAYFGEKKREKISDGFRAYDVIDYKSSEIERIMDIAFDVAMKRKKKLTLVDKSNVLETSKLWREIAKEKSKLYKEVILNYMYVDNAAMQLIKNPKTFDVIVTENMFGDILSDEASIITGSLGMLPSASLGNSIGLYEPIHGSAPDIAGKSLANPIGTILSVAMMLKYSFGMNDASSKIKEAVNSALNKGFRTKDIMEEGMISLSTIEMGNKIIQEL